MNEHESRGSTPRHRVELGVDALPATTDDSIVLAQWEDGLKRFGDAFVAFAQLRLPEMQGEHVLTAFEDNYIGSFDSIEALADAQIDGLGWQEPLDRLRREEGITPDLLDWDRAAIIRQLSLAYSLVVVGEKVHLFAA